MLLVMMVNRCYCFLTILNPIKNNTKTIYPNIYANLHLCLLSIYHTIKE